MTSKEIFEAIDLEKVGPELKTKLLALEKATEGFTNERADARMETSMNAVYNFIKDKKPEALKNVEVKTVTVEETITKTQGGKKVRTKQTIRKKVAGKRKKNTKKTPTPSAKNPIPNVPQIAREIREEGESWSDALSRAKVIYNKKKDDQKVKAKKALDDLRDFMKSDKFLKGWPRTYGKENAADNDLERDLARPAKAPGRRVSKTGRVYYENRDNRSDREANTFPRKIYLKDGGEVMIEPTILQNNPDYITSTATMSDYFEKGGYVAVSEKDGYWYIISKPTSKEEAQKVIDMGVPRGEMGKVVILDEAKAYKKVIGREYLEKGGKISSMTTYVPNRSIKELSVLLGKKLKTLKGSDVVDGVYVKNDALKSNKSTSLSSVDGIFEDVISLAKTNGLEDDINIVKKDDIQKLLDAGYDHEDIMLIYFGPTALTNVNIDNEIGLGLFGYTEDFVPEKIENLIEAAKNKTYELGLKYPDFTWSDIIKKYKIDKNGKDVNGEERTSKTSSISARGAKDSEYYIYRIFEGDKVVVGTRIDRFRIVNGKKDDDDYYRRDLEEVNNFKGGYWGVVSSDKKIIKDITKMILRKKSGYVKDIEIFVNGLGGLDANTLDLNKIPYELGGEVMIEPTILQNNPDYITSTATMSDYFEKGGAIGFDALAKKVAKRYAGKKVKPEYQDEYGKTYSDEEAMEVGRKVAAKVYRQQQAKMEKGGKLDGAYYFLIQNDGDEFVMSVEEGFDGKFVERLISGYSKKPLTKKYLSHLTKQDLLNWLNSDFDSVQEISQEEAMQFKDRSDSDSEKYTVYGSKADPNEFSVFKGNVLAFVNTKDRNFEYVGDITYQWGMNRRQFAREDDDAVALNPSDWPKGLEEILKKNSFAKGGNVESMDKAWEVKVMRDDEVLETFTVRGRNRGEAREVVEDYHEDKMERKHGDDIFFAIEEAPAKFAKGGAMEHMIMKGDEVLAIHKNMLIVESDLGQINVIDLSTEPIARRISVEPITGKNTLSAAKEHIDYLVSRKPKTMAMGGSLEGHGLKEGDLIVEDLGSSIMVLDEDGETYYVDLREGERYSEEPLPFEHGGEVKIADIARLAAKYNKTGQEVAAAISEGADIEVEHTEDRKKAMRIAVDHLDEDFYYYPKLKAAEGQPDFSDFYEKGGEVPEQFLDSKGERKIDKESIKELTDYVMALPQTKSIYFNEEAKEYVPSRRKLHADIINKFKENVVCITEGQPIAIFMGGSPASGKSSFLRKYSPYLLKEEILKVDADEIRAMLPEYEGYNAAQTHLETKDIVNTLLSDKNIGIPCDFDLIYDGTMNSVKSYIPLMDILRKRGYKIFIVYMDKVPKDVIIKRALERYKKSGRFVPLEVIEDFFEKGKTAFNDLKKNVDGYMVIDGSNQDYEIIEQGGMKLPTNREYSKLGSKIDPKDIPALYKKGGKTKKA